MKSNPKGIFLRFQTLESLQLLNESELHIFHYFTRLNKLNLINDVIKD